MRHIVFAVALTLMVAPAAWSQSLLGNSPRGSLGSGGSLGGDRSTLGGGGGYQSTTPSYGGMRPQRGGGLGTPSLPSVAPEPAPWPTMRFPRPTPSERVSPLPPRDPGPPVGRYLEKPYDTGSDKWLQDRQMDSATTDPYSRRQDRTLSETTIKRLHEMRDLENGIAPLPPAPRSGGVLPPSQPSGGGGSIVDRAQRQLDGGGSRWSR